MACFIVSAAEAVITTGYALIDLTPDDPKYSAEMAEAMIEAERQSSADGIRSTRSPDVSRMLQKSDEKFDRRLALYRSGVKQWDTTTSVIMIIRGVK